MQLSRKQVVLISVASGVVLLLTVALILIFSPKDADLPAEPAPSPTDTAPPTAPPTALPTPIPTAFRLPLVPQQDEPGPTAEPSGAIGAFAPRLSVTPDLGQSGGTIGPWVMADDECTRDILAVGLRDGRAAVLLFLRLGQERLTLAALSTDVMGKTDTPLEDTVLSGYDLAVQGEQAAALVGELTGRRYGAWLAMDLACLPMVLKVTGPMAGHGAEMLDGDGQQRAQGALTLGTGAATFFRQASLLKFPAIRQAAGDAFASNLSTRELWSLFWTLRNGVTIRALLLPTDGRQVDLSVLENFFGESS